MHILLLILCYSVQAQVNFQPLINYYMHRVEIPTPRQALYCDDMGPVKRQCTSNHSPAERKNASAGRLTLVYVGELVWGREKGMPFEGVCGRTQPEIVQNRLIN